MKNLLFITWDGPQTSYMEGLFMPIFHEITKKENINFHVIQFTWAEEEKITAIQKSALEMGIHYTAFPILKKPIASLGSLFTLFTSTSKIEKYIHENHIDIVMPRSTFPAYMVNKLKNKDIAIIFDADGLPIEERVDFAGLKKGSLLYRFLTATETKMLIKAEAIITRSQKAIDIHTKTIGEQSRAKFSVVQNGRNAEVFNYNPHLREQARRELGMQNDFLFVYAGSLGPQYGLEEMFEIFEAWAPKKEAKFLILTGNREYAEGKIPKELKSKILLKKVDVNQVPYYLNAADVAFGLRQPAYSMQGVAPIKLGEYLLCGLPVIASKGIGDTEEILQNFEECYLFDHDLDVKDELPHIMNFIEKAIHANRNQIQLKAQDFFSLQSAAESYIRVLNQFEK